MTSCDKIQTRLTAYLDGELPDDHGSVVRGHLRECAACRLAARDEARLRDGLRVLAPVDPPATLWAGVQARLAAAEVADARKPGWRHQAERWARWMSWARWTPVPQLAAATAVAVVIVATMTWRTRHTDEPTRIADGSGLGSEPGGPSHVTTPPPPTPTPTPAPPSADDVTADLIAEPAWTTASYDGVIEELMKLTVEKSAQWTAESRAAFESRVAGLRNAIAHAGQPRSVQSSQRALIRFLQSALVRDDVVLASGGIR